MHIVEQLPRCWSGTGVVGGSRNGLLTASGDGRKYFASNLGQSGMVNNKGGWLGEGSADFEGIVLEKME